MLDIVVKIKLGKSSSGLFKPEHLFYGSPDLLCHLHLLFNGLLQHGYVPIDFLRGSISPIIKDSYGDLSDTSNYRGITLGCLPAKLFEFAIQIKTSHLLGTDELQYGFKKSTSTNHALYTLKTSVHYFVNNGSNIFAAFLDCSKAFDRVSHYGLFTKLIDRKVPLCILLCLVFWYLNMTSVVKWGSSVIRSFRVPLGVKQGGINSPEFFGCYIDGIALILRNLSIGCYLFGIFVGMLLFADDLCLLAPTRKALEVMISECAKFFTSLGLSFNAKKSRILVFSKNIIDYSILKPICIDGVAIDYVDSVKYLGTTLVSDKGLTFSSKGDLLSFYRASNSILRSTNKPSEDVLLHLLYSNCVPILTYACAVKEFPSRQMHTCNTALNDALRFIFGYNRWESVRTLREYFGYKSLTELFSFTKMKFEASLLRHHNTIVSHIARKMKELVEHVEQ